MLELFPPLSMDLRHALGQLPQALEAVLPLNTAHRRQLPLAIEELSERLTTDRGLGALPYWSAPRLTAAYLWYFLPWNILRLARLFSGLDERALPAPTPLALRSGGEAQPRILADMGSGPLSLPLALWLAKPQWREIPLTVLCLDAAPRPLELGQRLFAQLAGDRSPWRIVTARAPLDNLGRELSRLEGVPWLLSGANVLNEVKARPRSQEQGVGERLEVLVDALSGLLRSDDARILLVEPGTRLGGKTMLMLREAALEAELAPCAPCTHSGPCPLEDSRTWCHFTFDVDGAPLWLQGLSQDAHLRKDALSLAFLLLRRNGEAQPERQHAETNNACSGGKCAARIVSAAFAVPGVMGAARYACAERGLALLPRAGGLPSGAQVNTVWPDNPTQDRKSGAFIVEHTEKVADLAPPRRGSPTAPRSPQRAQAQPGERRQGPDTPDTRGARDARDAHGYGEERRPSKDAPRPKKKAPVKSKKKPAPKFWEK